MSITTVLSRRVFLVGLAMPILPPVARVRAQGSAPLPPSRAPFQLTWGMSVKNVHDLINVNPNFEGSFDPRSTKEYGIYLQLGSYVTLPHTPDGTEKVTLYFGYRDELSVVEAKGQAALADAATNRYKELSSLLSELYGPGRETSTARSWFGQPDLDSVLKETSFSINDVQVTLSLRRGYIGRDIDAAYWYIVYQNRAGVAQFQADHLKQQKDAL